MRSHPLPLLGATPRKSSAVPSPAAEHERKALAERIGKAIERAILLSNLTKQGVAFDMGYPDASALSRWIAGTETAQFARLWMVASLRASLVVALAELAQPDGATVETTVTIRRTA